MFKIVPAGKGLAMLQSDPMPIAEAEAKLAKINDEMGEEKPIDGEKPEAMPTLQPLLEQPSALRSALSAIEANVSFARAQIEAAEDDEDEMLLLM